MNNGSKIKLGLTIGVVFFAVASGYAEVKFRSINNEKNVDALKKETNDNIKEIKKDQTTMLVKQGSMSTDITHVLKQQTRILTLLEELKKDSN